MSATLSSPAGVITKVRLALAISLVATWWLAHIFPHYKPMIQAEFSSQIHKARQKIPAIKVDWTTTDDPRARYNQSKIAMIIEPRVIPHLVPQLLHMISVVPPDWRFLFIGSNKSVVSVGRSYATKHQQVIGKLDLMILPEPWEIESKEKVFRLLTDIRFYNEFLPGIEWILKFEADSILCSNSETSLNDWLHWSWAGAPRSPDDRFSGNGGLSLRRVSSIRKILEFQERYNDTEPEDEWFGKRLWVLPGEKVAAGSEGVLAVEDVPMESPMGYHVREGGRGISDNVWKTPAQRKAIFNYCPELSMIMDMKLERERCPEDNGEGGLGPTAAEREIEEKLKLDAETRRKAAEEEAARLLAEQKVKDEEEAARKKAQAEIDAAQAMSDEERMRLDYGGGPVPTLSSTPTPSDRPNPSKVQTDAPPASSTPAAPGEVDYDAMAKAMADAAQGKEENTTSASAV